MISLFISFLWISIIGCNKDENDPKNQTNGKTTAVFNPDLVYGTITDQEGNIYKTVTIGTQIWMAENLRTTKFNDGTSIPHVTDNFEWSQLKITSANDWSHLELISAYCTFDNADDPITIATYGNLYNYYAVATGKLAPIGWHVPDKTEWTILLDYLGDDAGGKLKETDTTHWNRPNTGATNETGYTALPGSSRSENGSFGSIGWGGLWWQGPSNDYVTVYKMGCDNSDVGILWRGISRETGCSVRCVKD